MRPVSFERGEPAPGRKSRAARSGRATIEGVRRPQASPTSPPAVPRRGLGHACAAGLAALLAAGCFRSGLEPARQGLDGGGDGGDEAGTDADPPPDAPPDEVPVSVSIAVADDLDDGELDGSESFGEAGYAPQGERSCWTYAGAYDPATAPGDGRTVSFFRFALPEAIPPGARIDEARLRLFGRDLWRWRPEEHTLWVFVERSLDAPRISSIADLPGVPGEGRPLLGVSVAWGVEAGEELHWRLEGWNESPDLSPLFQGLVRELSGLAEGAHVQLFLFRVGAATDGEVAAEDFCHEASNHATLRLSWTEPR